jgi:hypothetical protein
LAPWRFAALTASGGGAMNGRDPASHSVHHVHDADGKRAWEPELGALFDKRFGKKCAFVVGPVIGFDSRDRILFEAGDYYEEGDNDPVPETRCLGHRGVWALDATGAKLIEVPPA